MPETLVPLCKYRLEQTIPVAQQLQSPIFLGSHLKSAVNYLVLCPCVLLACHANILSHLLVGENIDGLDIMEFSFQGHCRAFPKEDSLLSKRQFSFKAVHIPGGLQHNIPLLDTSSVSRRCTKHLIEPLHFYASIVLIA